MQRPCQAFSCWSRMDLLVTLKKQNKNFVFKNIQVKPSRALLLLGQATAWSQKLTSTLADWQRSHSGWKLSSNDSQNVEKLYEIVGFTCRFVQSGQESNLSSDAAALMSRVSYVTRLGQVGLPFDALRVLSQALFQTFRKVIHFFGNRTIFQLVFF